MNRTRRMRRALNEDVKRAYSKGFKAGKRASLKLKESNDYLDKEDDPIAIIYDVYVVLKAFGWGRRDYLDVLKDVVDSRGYYTADDIRDIADVLEDSGDYGEEAEALRYAADDLER